MQQTDPCSSKNNTPCYDRFLKKNWHSQRIWFDFYTELIGLSIRYRASIYFVSYFGLNDTIVQKLSLPNNGLQITLNLFLRYSLKFVYLRYDSNVILVHNVTLRENVCNIENIRFSRNDQCVDNIGEFEAIGSAWEFRKEKSNHKLLIQLKYIRSHLYCSIGICDITRTFLKFLSYYK